MGQAVIRHDANGGKSTSSSDEAQWLVPGEAESHEQNSPDASYVLLPDGQVVHTFTKNTREEVVSYFAPDRGRMLVHIRVFTENKEDQIVPTKKGIAVRVEDLPKLAEAVQALVAAAETELT